MLLFRFWEAGNEFLKMDQLLHMTMSIRTRKGEILKHIDKLLAFVISDRTQRNSQPFLSTT